MRINTTVTRTFFVIIFLMAKNTLSAQNGIVKGKVRSETELLAAATVSLDDLTILSDVKGEFFFSIKPGNYILKVTYAGYKTIEKQITVREASVEDFDLVLQPSGEMENVIILGSRSMKERSSLNTPVPIDILRLSQLSSKQVELTNIVSGNVPSFNAAAHGFGPGKHMLPASLRSLGPDQTLVLVNGRRLHSMASPWVMGVTGFGTVGFDLNAIPSAAVETVEILRDGASAQYGSDAIAGVVNLKLKNSASGTTIQLHTGQYYKGDGEAFSIGLNHGTSFLKKGFLNLTGHLRFNNYTKRTGIYDSTVYYNIPVNATPGQKDTIRLLDDQKIAERGFDRNGIRPIGNNRVWNAGFVMNAGYPVSEKTNLFWTAIWNHRFVKDRSSSLYRFPKDSSRMVNTRIYPDGFLPMIEYTIPDVSIIGGLDGIANNGWRWDASVSFGENSNKATVTNSNNASQYLLGLNAPTEFYTGEQSFSQLTQNINFTKELIQDRNAIRSLHVAIGTEFRIDHYRIKEGEEASWQNYNPASGRNGGSQGLAGFQPENAIDKYRQVLGSYAEIELEKNEKLLLNFAGRYEYYSDYGGNLAGKLAFRYKFSKYLLWRGSVSNGFRAPSLQQRYYSLITTVTRFGSLLRTGTFRNNSDVARAFGISPLQGETAMNFSTGITSSLSKNISITADAYWIQIKDRVIYSGNIPDSRPEVRSILDSFGFKDVQIVRFFSNAINTRTKGMDVVINSSWNLNNSILEVSLAANLNKTELYGAIQYAKNLPDDESYRNLLVNREERCRVETAYPKDKIILNLAYKSGKWIFSSGFVRYGKVEQKTSDPKNFPDEIFSPKIVSAMNLSYKLKSQLTFTVGAENISDVYPDKLRYRNNTANGVTPYNPNFAPFGCNGGYYFLNISCKW